MPHWWKLAISLVVTAAVVFPTLWWAQPHMVRRHVLDHLNSDNEQDRARALNYILRVGAKDPRVIHGVIDRMAQLNDDRFAHVMIVLDQLGMWRRPTIPPDQWLRWLSTLSAEKDPKARILAAQELAKLTDLNNHAAVLDMLERLMGDANTDVRYNTLVATSGLWSVNHNNDKLRHIIAKGSNDPEPEVARQTWIFLGLTGLPNDMKTNWRAVAPRAALPMFWTLTRAAPENPAAALEAIGDRQTPFAVRAAAIFSLAYAKSADAADALLEAMSANANDTLSEEDAVVMWRAILAGAAIDEPVRTQAQSVQLKRIVEQVAMHTWPNDAILAPLAIAATYRLGVPTTFQPSQAIPQNEDLRPALAALAAAESVTSGVSPPPLYDNAPALYQLALVERLDKPDPSILLDVLADEMPMLRDQACVVAASRFTREQNTELARGLLVSFSDDGQRSGAFLAGLTDARPRGRTESSPSQEQDVDLLLSRLEIEDDWRQAQIFRVGLWMQGRLSELDGVGIEALLTRKDLPTTSLLLAMLHKRDHNALEYLLNPRGEPRMDLIDLLVHKRWWRVLKKYLPADAPLDLSLWADEEVQQFQIDVLRNWYLLESARISAPAAENR